METARPRRIMIPSLCIGWTPCLDDGRRNAPPEEGWDNVEHLRPLECRRGLKPDLSIVARQGVGRADGWTTTDVSPRDPAGRLVDVGVRLGCGVTHRDHSGPFTGSIAEHQVGVEKTAEIDESTNNQEQHGEEDERHLYSGGASFRKSRKPLSVHSTPAGMMNNAFTLVPNTNTAPTMATAMNATMRPYSTAVAPRSAAWA